jgi:hypothetical protein
MPRRHGRTSSPECLSGEEDGIFHLWLAQERNRMGARGLGDTSGPGRVGRGQIN